MGWFAQLMRALFISTFVSGPKMITFVSFIILISTSTVSSFSPQAVFFMIAILNVTRVSCSLFLPLEMMFLSEAYGATKRIEEFLLLEERSQKSLPTAKASAPTSHDDVIISDSSPGTVLLSETEGSWNGTDPV